MDVYTMARVIAWGVAMFGPEPGTSRVTPGFPIAVPFTGCAFVSGAARAEPPFELRHASVRYWIGGGVVHTTPAVLYPDGSYFAVITGLKRGVEYNVMVQVVQIRENERVTLANLRFVKGR